MPPITDWPLPIFPAVWDATMRASFVSCPRQFYNAHVLGLRIDQPNIHLHWGGALAKGLEVARRQFHIDHVRPQEAVQAGLQCLIEYWGDFESNHDKKTLASCVLALSDYFDNWPLDQDPVQPFFIAHEGQSRRPAIECSFALPLDLPHPTSGEPIIYAGRFDMLGEFSNAIYIVDEKSATALGKSWRLGFRLRSQFTGYAWGARTYGVPVAGILIRGVSPLMRSTNFEQVIETRPDWLIDRWHTQLHHDIQRAINCWHANQWDYTLDGACSAYGNGCQFLDLCTSQHPERWLPDYTEHRWDPLTRTASNGQT